MNISKASEHFKASSRKKKDNRLIHETVEGYALCHCVMIIVLYGVLVPVCHPESVLSGSTCQCSPKYKQTVL
jgi:hypothetical protein